MVVALLSPKVGSPARTLTEEQLPHESGNTRHTSPLLEPAPVHY